MEAVLDTYALPYDARRPVICFDEKSYQMLDHVRDPLPPVPGHPAQVDYEYKRCSTVTVTERRGNAEFAAELQALDVRYAVADTVVLVLDQLSTHSPAALYQQLPAEEARRLSRRFEWVYTPKHGVRLAAEQGSALVTRITIQSIQNTPARCQDRAGDAVGPGQFLWGV